MFPGGVPHWHDSKPHTVIWRCKLHRFCGTERRGGSNHKPSKPCEKHPFTEWEMNRGGTT